MQKCAIGRVPIAQGVTVFLGVLDCAGIRTMPVVTKCSVVRVSSVLSVVRAISLLSKLRLRSCR